MIGQQQVNLVFRHLDGELFLVVVQEALLRQGDRPDGVMLNPDLIGLAAVNAANEPLGRVVAIHNFGAGDIIEIAPAQGPTMLLPFTNAVVPTVDLKGGRVVIELPQEIEGDDVPTLT